MPNIFQWEIKHLLTLSYIQVYIEIVWVYLRHLFILPEFSPSKPSYEAV